MDGLKFKVYRRSDGRGYKQFWNRLRLWLKEMSAEELRAEWAALWFEHPCSRGEKPNPFIYEVVVEADRSEDDAWFYEELLNAKYRAR